MKVLIGILSVVAFMLTCWNVAAKNLESFDDFSNDPFNIKSIYFKNSRIVNGVRATLGQIPEQVYLTGYTDPLGLLESHSCGGAILTAQWVLTAAHCLLEATDLGTPVLSYRLQAGMVNLYIPGSTEQSILVVALGNIFPHPDYNVNTFENDIGLIRATSLLVSEFDLSQPNIGAANLPSSTVNMDDYDGTDLTISGFGLTRPYGSTSTVLYTAVIQVITHATCQQIYRTVPIPSTAFCAQDRTRPFSAVCDGDSGGPATIMIGTTRTLVGIVSFGLDPCDRYPQGFTEVAKFIDWINGYIQ